MVAGASIAALAGFLKATVGAHEVITTIMLNWIAYWIGSFLFGRGGPLQNSVDVSVPISNDVVPSGKLPTFWGNPELQALHVGFFIALGALVVFWLMLNRTTLGYQVRAVGFNPEAARYGGINVARNYVYAMAISGAFAGLGGAMDILGWQYRLGVLDIQVSNIGFIGIAVALLGRNTAVGVGLAALLFGALVNGTSTRGLDPSVFPPQLAGNLTLMIQALVLLFVGADVLILVRLEARKKVGLGTEETPPHEPKAQRRERTFAAPTREPRSPRRTPREVARAGIVLGSARVLPHAAAAARRTQRWVPLLVGLLAVACGIWAVTPRRAPARLGRRSPSGSSASGSASSRRTRRTTNLTTVVSWGALIGSTLVWATPLAYAAVGGMFSERSGVVNIGLEGMMLAGAFFACLGADKFGSWEMGLVTAAVAGAGFALVHAFFAIHLRADQIVGGTAINFLALGVTGYFFIQVYGENGTPGDLPHIPNASPPASWTSVTFFGDAVRRPQPDDLALVRAPDRRVVRPLPHAGRAAAARGRRASARGGDGRHLAST